MNRKPAIGAGVVALLAFAKVEREIQGVFASSVASGTCEVFLLTMTVSEDGGKPIVEETIHRQIAAIALTPCLI